MQAYKFDPNERSRIVRADDYRRNILETSIDEFVVISEFLFRYQTMNYSDISCIVHDLLKYGYLEDHTDEHMRVFYKTTFKGRWLLFAKFKKGFDIPMNSGYY